MPRCARAVSITGYYHVYDRGNSKQIIFEDDSDRYRFLSDISDRFARHEVAVLAWCLMDNHFHLMVDDPLDNLSKAMQCALTAYAKYFNGKTGRTGHLFDNRYSRVAVESDTQAVQLLDYIHLNPVKGALDSLEAYRWSSYKAYQLGYDPFDICDAAPMLDIVGGSRCYCEHLEEVAGRIWSVEVLPRRRIPDEDALSVACEVLPSIDPALLKALPRPERDALSAEAQAGASHGQANCPYHRYRRYKRDQGHHRLERGGVRQGTNRYWHASCLSPMRENTHVSLSPMSAKRRPP